MDLWQNSNQFFGAASLCTTTLVILEDNLKNRNDRNMKTT